MKKLTWIVIVPVMILATSGSLTGQWKKLIKKDLSNWTVLNGTAPYEIKDGIITGKTVVSSPNSFLCTKETFSDFILEFETWFDSRMNSGVQIRSESRPDYQNGRVHGYQVEMDPSERAWSGGIYDEARRGWLYALDINPAGQKAFKKDDWNHYRIEATGNSIRTWVNGIPCADLVDDMTPAGFIALQVHGIGKDESRAGLLVKWRNIRIITKNVQKYSTPYKPEIPQVSYLTNKLTDREAAEGWRLLWDGISTNGWRSIRSGSFPETGWKINDGMLTVLSSKEQPKRGGDIVTKDLYRNFELVVDFMYSKGANSGIKYFIAPESEKGVITNVGCEYQILDDRNHPDAKAGFEGNRTLAGLYDVFAPVNKRDNGFDKWNRAVIIVKGNHVEHWLNGQKTVEYERKSARWYEAIAKSKFRDTPGFAETGESHILLQDHGNQVSFRNIKIREIK